MGLREVIQFCDLMVTGRLEDILDGKKRVRDYPAIDPRHLLILLRKFRCDLCHLSVLSVQQAGCKPSFGAVTGPGTKYKVH